MHNDDVCDDVYAMNVCADEDEERRNEIIEKDLRVYIYINKCVYKKEMQTCFA